MVAGYIFKNGNFSSTGCQGANSRPHSKNQQAAGRKVSSI